MRIIRPAPEASADSIALFREEAAGMGLKAHTTRCGGILEATPHFRVSQ
jgi:hypothetical protein